MSTSTAENFVKRFVHIYFVLSVSSLRNQIQTVDRSFLRCLQWNMNIVVSQFPVVSMKPQDIGKTNETGCQQPKWAPPREAQNIHGKPLLQTFGYSDTKFGIIASFCSLKNCLRVLIFFSKLGFGGWLLNFCLVFALANFLLVNITFVRFGRSIALVHASVKQVKFMFKEKTSYIVWVRCQKVGLFSNITGGPTKKELSIDEDSPGNMSSLWVRSLPLLKRSW